MRRVTLAWCLGSVLVVLACGDGNTNGQPSAACGAGMEPCNNGCVATGTCQSTSVCGAGMESCNGGCVVAGNCQSGCAAGSIRCGTSCVLGTTCPIASGGQTSGTKPVGTGGATAVVATTATGSGGKTTATAQGGSGAKGGTTAKGGSAAKGGTTGKATTVVSTGGTAVVTTSTVDPNPGTCSDTSSLVVTLPAQYSKTNIPLTNNAGKTYAATANWWGVYKSQSIALNGLSFTVSNSGAASSGNDPIGFPAIMIGQYQTLATGGSNLPKLVSSLTTIPTIFNTNLSSLDGSNLNASLDVWFNTTTDALGVSASAPTGGYLMVWQAKPSNRQPRGSVRMSGQTVGTVPGKWDVWADSQCVSYVSTTTQSSLTFDLNDFIKHAVTNNQVIKSNWYLAVVFAGFEIWSGGNGAKLNQFCAKVN